MPDEKNKTLIGARIREVRTAKGITQADLAKESGLNEIAISRIECGNREPLASTIQAIARALGVTPGHLFLPPTEIPETKMGRPAQASPARVAKVKRPRGRPRKSEI